MPASHETALDQEPDSTLSGAADTWPLTAREAADALGVNERTIRRAIARGDIVAAKRAGAFRIAPEELRRYRTRRAGAEATPATARFASPYLIALPGGLSSPHATLPRPLTSLVGREAEIAEVRALIRQHDIRLVTLTGPGGVGKTRLAIAAADEGHEFAHGVVFVSLASIRDPQLVGAGIAQAFGVRGGSGRSLVERLEPMLKDRRMLLVLDNFEHVADSAPLVAELLSTFPGLTALITSRVRLGLMAEHRWEVPPLAMGAGDSTDPHPDVLPPAVQLFIERARAVRPDVFTDHRDARAVEVICRRLDGLPLAIELAAVRVNVVTPRALLERLEPRLPLLSGGWRGLPERQQTMRDAIAWSYDLLPSPVREMFRRLSVFVGGFTLEAAARVTATLDAMPGLATLVDASLLRLVTGATGQARYLMLETVREFGHEMLERLGEAAGARQAHATYYRELGSWLDPNTIAPGVTVDDRLREIEPEQPNLEAALTYLAEIGDDAGLLYLAGQCAIFWHHRAFLIEGRRWLERALANAPTAPTIERGNALAGLSLVLWTQVEPALAAPLAKEALAIGRHLDDDHLTALSLHLLAIIATLEARWEEAKAHMETALPLWLAVGEQSSAGMALMILGEIEYELGAFDRSHARAEAALALFAAVGHDSGSAFSLVRLGRIAHHRRRLEDALAAYREALRLWSGIGERWASIKALVGLAEIATVADQPDVAATLIGVIDHRVAETGGGVFPVDRRHYDRALDAARAALGEDRVAQLRAEGSTLPPDAVMAQAMDIATPATRRKRGETGALSRREHEVLRLLAEGRSNPEIAASLYISVHTARSHVESILAKLGVPTRTAAAAHALRHHLI